MTSNETDLARKWAAIHRLARGTLAVVWIYQGLVPKFLFRDWTEMTMLHDMGLDVQFLPSAVSSIGLLETGFGLMMLAAWRTRWPLWATIGALAGALANTARHSPELLHQAFNPVTLNGALLVLAVIALWTHPERVEVSGTNTG